MNKIISFFQTKTGKSIESVLAPHIPDLYRQAYRYSGNKPCAEDLLQELFVYVCQREEMLLKLDPVKPWLMRCLYHRFIDGTRKQSRQVKVVHADEDSYPVFCPAPTPEAQYQQLQVIKGLNQLSPEQRATISLFDIEGYGIDEVAKILDIAPGTVKSHLHRGRKKLKTLLELQPEQQNQRLTK